jgi:hypothetical protein
LLTDVLLCALLSVDLALLWRSASCSHGLVQLLGRAAAGPFARFRAKLVAALWR